MKPNAQLPLDYTNPRQVVNFRDVGAFINILAQASLLPTGRLFRGGTLRYVEGLHVVDYPRTIINLQKGPDPAFPNVVNHHFPISNDHEKYQTADPVVRAWLRQILGTVEKGVEEYPSTFIA